MHRRHLLLAGLAMPLVAVARAEALPARVALVDGGTARGGRFAGIAVDLDPGWKTYWRVPGEAGISPDFKWDGSRNLKAAEVLYPLPTRLEGGSGEAIGYERRVLFPVQVTPADAQQDVTLSLVMFFGVCKDLCVPQTAKLSLALPPGGTDQGVAPWLSRVPEAGQVAKTARLEGEAPLRLVLDLARPVSDIFVETAGLAYFNKPVFAGTTAALAIANVSREALAGTELWLTFAIDDKGVEQTLRLP